MNIAIIGTGNVGKALAQRWISKGHHIIFGTREPTSIKNQNLIASLGSLASIATLEQAAKSAKVLILAMPWEAAFSSVHALGRLDE